MYEVNNNIEIKIMDGIDNLEEIINSYEDPKTGEKFIKIKTNNKRCFCGVLQYFIDTSLFEYSYYVLYYFHNFLCNKS